MIKIGKSGSKISKMKKPYSKPLSEVRLGYIINNYRNVEGKNELLPKDNKEI